MLIDLLAGCSGMTAGQQRMLSGGAIGTGATIGAISGGSPVTDAVIGGIAGVAGGTIVNQSERHHIGC